MECDFKSRFLGRKYRQLYSSLHGWRYRKMTLKKEKQMALKIDGIGSPLMYYSYMVDIVDDINNPKQKVVMLSIWFIHNNIEKTRLYILKADLRHSNLNNILQNVQKAFNSTNNRSTLRITEDHNRMYIEFHYPKGQIDQYTGYSVRIGK